MKQRSTKKLICPYCKAKQEYKAKNYFTINSIKVISLDIRCDDCDQLFNSYLENGWVTSYPNLTYLPPKAEA